jgi:hypothetical protein
MLSAAQIKTIRDNDPGAVLPGIDTMTGNPYAPSTLLDLTKNHTKHTRTLLLCAV